jgi:hypothetical protein
MIEELVHADDELQTAKMVSFTSPTISEFRCPLATKIIKAMTRDRPLKRTMIPWKDPFPKPRISPPRTLGDAVIKKLLRQIARWTKDVDVV